MASRASAKKQKAISPAAIPTRSIVLAKAISTKHSISVCESPWPDHLVPQAPGKPSHCKFLQKDFRWQGYRSLPPTLRETLSGIAAMGEAKDAFVKRASEMGLNYQPDEFPVIFGTSL